MIYDKVCMYEEMMMNTDNVESSLLTSNLLKICISTLSEKGDQECPGHDFLMSRSAVHYVSSKSEA